MSVLFQKKISPRKCDFLYLWSFSSTQKLWLGLVSVVTSDLLSSPPHPAMVLGALYSALGLRGDGAELPTERSLHSLPSGCQSVHTPSEGPFRLSPS